LAQYEGQIEFSGMAGRVGLALARATWAALRLPILALLVILEPVVRMVLAGFALLMTLTALFFACVRPLPAFPFWGMLAVAIGSVGLLALYYALVRLFSG
jgi:hypothetical protein